MEFFTRPSHGNDGPQGLGFHERKGALSVLGGAKAREAGAGENAGERFAPPRQDPNRFRALSEADGRQPFLSRGDDLATGPGLKLRKAPSFVGERRRCVRIVLVHGAGFDPPCFHHRNIT